MKKIVLTVVLSLCACSHSPRPTVTPCPSDQTTRVRITDGDPCSDGPHDWVKTGATTWERCNRDGTRQISLQKPAKFEFEENIGTPWAE